MVKLKLFKYSRNPATSQNEYGEILRQDPTVPRFSGGSGDTSKRYCYNLPNITDREAK
jgi:hypothetical protein